MADDARGVGNVLPQLPRTFKPLANRLERLIEVPLKDVPRTGRTSSKGRSASPGYDGNPLTKGPCRI